MSTLHPPDGVRFTCSQCGDCCRQWNVWLGPGEADAIEALNFENCAPDLQSVRKTVAVKQSLLKGRHRLARRDDGRCVFLGDRNQCRLHEHFGADAKPLLCRLYPFGFYPMGGHVGVEVSFFCRAVNAGQGEPIGDRTPEWALLLERANTADTGKHFLRPGMPISGDLMWDLEHYLLVFLKTRALPMIARIECCLRFLQLGTTGDPTKPTAIVLRDAIADSLPAQYAKMHREGEMNPSQRAVFYQILFLMLNPLPAEFLEMSGVEQGLERQRRIDIGNRFRDNEGHPWIENRELGATFDDLRRVGTEAFDSDAAHALFETYFCAKIVGQKFLAAGERELPLEEATHCLLLLYAMAIWTARALAADRAALTVEEQDMRRALRLLDASLGVLELDAMPKKTADAWRTTLTEGLLPVVAAGEMRNANP